MLQKFFNYHKPVFLTVFTVQSPNVTTVFPVVQKLMGTEGVFFSVHMYTERVKVETGRGEDIRYSNKPGRQFL